MADYNPTTDFSAKDTLPSGNTNKIIRGAEFDTEFTNISTAIASKEDSFTKNTAFNKDFGTTAGTVAQGNDSRIVNGQTAFSWGDHASAGYALTSALPIVNNPTVTLTAGTGLTGGGTFTLNQAGNATITLNGVALSENNTWTGPQTFNAQATLTEIKETVFTLTGTLIDPANGSIQTRALSAATTFTESLEAGQCVVLMITGGATHAVTWPTTTWVGPNGNQAPTLTASDVVVLWKVSTTLYGAYVGSYA